MSTTNPLDAVYSQSAPSALSISTSENAAAQPPIATANPLDSIYSKSSNPLDNIYTQSTAQPSVANAPRPLSSVGGTNPLDSIYTQSPQQQEAKFGDVLTNEEADYGEKPPDEQPDEPWYSKAWNWMNSPLWDLHKYGTREGAGTFERGLETGLETLGSGITSPLSLGLILATFGGGAVEEAGIAALRSIGVAEKLAPTVVKSAKLLMDAGFATQMVGGLMTQVPQFLDALKDGDVENATRLGTEALGSGAFLTLGLKHGYEDLDALKTRVKGGPIK